MRVTLIGWGNRGRKDDGIAHHLLEMLAIQDWPDGIMPTLRAYHQLGPEVIIDLQDADVVVFMDAHVNLDEEAIAWNEIHASDGSTLDSHHCTPESLLQLATALGTPCPRAFTLGMRAFHCGYGDELSHLCQPLLHRASSMLMTKLADLLDRPTTVRQLT
ncbi:MAG: hypothetical protein ACPGXK_02610 [Phycisphaerae bacterium]